MLIMMLRAMIHSGNGPSQNLGPKALPAMVEGTLLLLESCGGLPCGCCGCPFVGAGGSGAAFDSCGTWTLNTALLAVLASSLFL